MHHFNPPLLYTLIAVAFVAGCGINKHQQPPHTQPAYCLEADFYSQVRLVKPLWKPVAENITLTGSVTVNPDKTVRFTSLADGIVTETYFSLGDFVQQGTVLAALRSTTLSDLLSQLKSLDAGLPVAEKKLQSAQTMFRDGISSQKEVMEAQRDLDILHAEREKVSADLSLYNASTEKGLFQLRAPVTGVVTQKSIASGTQVYAGGEPLFTLTDLNEVWVLINVYATNIQYIKTGMDVHISTLSYPGEVFQGRVTAIDHILDQETRVLKARVVLANKDQKLKPGMLTDVTIFREHNMEALSIPAAAMVFDDNQYYVVVYKDSCHMEIRQVDVLAEYNGTAFLSGGLDETETIISQNQLLVYSELKNPQS